MEYVCARHHASTESLSSYLGGDPVNRRYRKYYMYSTKTTSRIHKNDRHIRMILHRKKTRMNPRFVVNVTIFYIYLLKCRTRVSRKGNTVWWW